MVSLQVLTRTCENDNVKGSQVTTGIDAASTTASSSGSDSITSGSALTTGAEITTGVDITTSDEVLGTTGNEDNQAPSSAGALVASLILIGAIYLL